MCIICNLGLESDLGDRFLFETEKARKAMKAAADALLACSKADVTPEVRRRYDAAHKRMVKLNREWNSIEQQRERMTA